ncbi:hypothetical protein Pla175_30680 [Pirellulimonas nuda]|uniref:Uncharacterized protein n=1 Tax=Pirellulimonas nuda TaxID=2528009 RepID=A0A518DDW4_9BACT|nr:hypothetical protein [Pirellulimonas nuda]QDU89674.1 hypothetical protein Pla175_30680 [Pirellulimonas nuda]
MSGRRVAAEVRGRAAGQVVAGCDSLRLAEFDYDNKPRVTSLFDQSQERFSLLKQKEFAPPTLYWHGMPKGRA